MDTLIENGEFALDVCGYPVKIHSVDEAVQRVKIILSVKKGSFIYDRELGSDFSGLFLSGNFEKEAALRCREAIADQEEISLGKVRAEMLENGNILLNLEVVLGNEIKETEAELDAELWGNFE